MGLFNSTPTIVGSSLMDRLSRENGWTPDARQGHCIVHSFQGDTITPRRDVIIAHPPSDEIALFSCACRGSFLSRAMTVPQAALFAARNAESTFGKWQINIESGQISPKLQYTALVAGLNARNYRTICVSLVEEVKFVEEIFHSQGML